jgi:hypothetical protein
VIEGSLGGGLAVAGGAGGFVGVAVGGSAVLVGDGAVAVGGSGVAVSGTSVGVAVGSEQASIAAAIRVSRSKRVCLSLIAVSPNPAKPDNAKAQRCRTQKRRGAVSVQG